MTKLLMDFVVFFVFLKNYRDISILLFGKVLAYLYVNKGIFVALNHVKLKRNLNWCHSTQINIFKGWVSLLFQMINNYIQYKY